MSTFVLVHGAWHGGWCWEHLAPLLRAKGHHAETPDLPGHDGKPAAGARSGRIGLRDYVAAIEAVVAAQREPVVLVGHSMGGIVISEVADRLPGLVSHLVYLAAFLLPAGATLLGSVGADRASLLLRHAALSPDRRTLGISPEGVMPTFYHDCGAAVARRALPRLVAQPIAPLRAALRLDEQNWGRVPRVYVRCLRDRAVTPALQASMLQRLPCARVRTLDTGHFPQYAAPVALAEILTMEDGGNYE